MAFSTDDASPLLGIPGYENVLEIGRGGFGIVYRARQAELDRVVAVKVLTSVVDAKALQRFDRERKALGALSDHPNIVTIFESGTTARGMPFLTMEFLAGGSFGDRLASAGAVDWPSVVAMAVLAPGPPLPPPVATTSPATSTTLAPVLMPDVIGLSQAAARSAVTDLQRSFKPQGYFAYTESLKCNGNTDPSLFGTVHAQSPPAGTAMFFQQPASIDIYETCTTVPNLLGADRNSQAPALVLQAALQATYTMGACQSGVGSNVVIAQDLADGSIVKTNSIVRVTFTPASCP